MDFHSLKNLYCLLWILLTDTISARIIPAGAGYVGSGYNVLFGNADGSRFASGGPDNGLLPTKIILQKNLPLTSAYCPDEAVCTEVASDISDDQYALITDLQQYQSLYSSGWDFDTDQPPAANDWCHPVEQQIQASRKIQRFSEFTKDKTKNERETKAVQFLEALLPVESSFAGTRSSSVSDLREIIEVDKDIVLDKRKNTIVSEVRYNYKENQKLTTEFILDLCELPLDYSAETYRRFLSSWGTHIIVGAKLGILEITRYKVPFSILNGLLLRLPGLSSLTKLDATTSKISYNSSEFQNLGAIQTLINIVTIGPSADAVIQKWQFATGSPNIPTPIHLVLRRLDFFMTPAFLESAEDTRCPQLAEEETALKLQLNIRRALFDYPILSAAPMLFPFTRTFRLNWPKGSYALLKTDRCPETGPSHAWYGAGVLVLPDLLQMYTESLPSTEFDMALTPGSIWSPTGELSLKFCVKVADSSEGSFDWPMGSYCIFKKGFCPAGFSYGSISTVAAKVTLANEALPDGLFDGTTHLLEFCCRTDKAIDQPIILPTSQTFSLLSTGGQCQRIQGMESSLRIQSIRKGDLSGSHPFITSTDLQTMRIHICYYKPWTPQP